MTQFSLSQLFSGLFILCLVITTCYLFILTKKQRHQQHQLHVTGLLKLDKYRKLLAQFQQHRGLSNGILNGDITLTPRLEAASKLIQQSITDIIATYPDMAENERWLSMDDHWQRLSVYYHNLSVRHNLEQHNKLVLNLLYLIDDIAVENKLHQLHNEESKSIQYLWQELLFTAESMAQIRALGTGIAAANLCTPVERIRLNYLCHSLEQSIAGQHNQNYLLTIAHLLTVIDCEVTIDKPTIKADRFFDIATECIDMTFASFDKQLNLIEQKLHNATLRDEQH
ncbi:MAG: hypothetical protein ACI86X_001371 [Moritella sp.]|jgi:hypothetical protein